MREDDEQNNFKTDQKVGFEWSVDVTYGNHDDCVVNLDGCSFCYRDDCLAKSTDVRVDERTVAQPGGGVVVVDELPDVGAAVADVPKSGDAVAPGVDANSAGAGRRDDAQHAAAVRYGKHVQSGAVAAVCIPRLLRTPPGVAAGQRKLHHAYVHGRRNAPCTRTATPVKRARK